MVAIARNRRFDILWHALMFNVYTGTPNPIILPFLKNHFPYLAKHPEPAGWTMYPPGPVIIPQHGMHSLRVDRHPFIKAKHTGARIDLLTQEWKEGPPGLEAIRIWIYLDSKAQAKAACNQIVKKFRNIGAQTKRLSYTNKETITIKDPDEDHRESLTIILKKASKPNEYSILILSSGDKGDPW
jgi:hypothetical protein